MNRGKLDIVKREMEKIGVNLLGMSEMKWTGMGHFKCDGDERDAVDGDGTLQV